MLVSKASGSRSSSTLVGPPGSSRLPEGHSDVDVIPVDNDRELRIDQATPGEQRPGLRGVDLQPLVRLRDAGQEVAKPMVLRVEPAADNPHAGPTGLMARS